MSPFQRFDKFQLYDIWLKVGLSALTLTVMVGIYLVVFRPVLGQIEVVHEEATKLRDLIQRAPEIATRQQTLTVELANSQKAETELTKRIPAAPRESDFLHQISQLADQIGLQVTDYRPGVIDQRENHHEMEVKVNTRGNYESLCKFLKQIDHLPRLCRLTQLDVNTDVKDQDLNVDMSFRIYFAPPTTDEKKG